MKKYVCTVCGYIAEGEIPAQCPVCKAPASAFVEKTGNTYVTEHVVGSIPFPIYRSHSANLTKYHEK